MAGYDSRYKVLGDCAFSRVWYSVQDNQRHYGNWRYKYVPFPDLLFSILPLQLNY